MTLMSKIDQLKDLIKKDLPGEKAHFSMTPNGRLKNSEYLENLSRDHVNESAVTIILNEQENLTKIILIQRPNYQGNHGGQISFPGGKKELTDDSLFHTAIRECYEEIGYQPKNEDYLGQLTPVYIPYSNFYIEPSLFFTCDNLQFNINQCEVEEILLIDFSVFFDYSTIQTKEVNLINGIKKMVPCFYINEKIIWGATALILNELKMLIEMVNKKVM
jgi:8-oxo-dGTP pyrophosphatase MutT (NUDIX family)